MSDAMPTATSASNSNPVSSSQEEQHDIEMKNFVAKCCKPISREEQAKVASYPQGSSSPEWLAARVGRLTGSVVGAVFGVNKYDSPDKRLQEMLFSDFKGNAATQYGNDNEKTGAAKAFEHVMAHRLDGSEVDEHGFTLVDVSIEDRGLCVCRNKPFLAMSPDGIMNETWRREDHFGSHAGASAFVACVLETAKDINSGEAWLLEAKIAFAEETVVATIVKQKKLLVEYKCPYSKRNKGWYDAEDVYPLEQIQKATAPTPLRSSSDAQNHNNSNDDDDENDDEDDDEDDENDDGSQDIGNQNPLTLPMPSYYYAQVQYGMHILGVLDDMLTVPQTSYFVVWHPAYCKHSVDTKTHQHASSTPSPLSNARLQLWTARNAADTSTTYAGPYGTVQVTKVQYNKQYCKALMKCATEFSLTRLLPSIYLKSVGLLQRKPQRAAYHRRSKPIFMQFNDQQEQDSSDTLGLSLADLEAQFAVAGYALENTKNDGSDAGVVLSSMPAPCQTTSTQQTVAGRVCALPSHADKQRDQQSDKQHTKDMLRQLNIIF